MKVRLVLGLIVFLTSATAALSQTLNPTETVKEFYKFSNARSALFNRRHIESRKRWYTPALYNLFLEELKKEQAFLKQHPTEKPFFGDGLSFRPLEETCEANGKHYRRSQRISRTETTGSQAYVALEFAYPQACSEDPVYYRVQLKKVRGRWLIDDLTYSNGMTLTREMKENKY